MHKKIIFAKIFIYLQVPALAERLVRCLLSSLFILPFDEKPGNNSENCSSFLKKSLYIEEYKGNFSPTANLSLCAVCMRGNFSKPWTNYVRCHKTFFEQGLPFPININKTAHASFVSVW